MGTKSEILAAARMLFARNGYHATGIAEISEAAGLSRSAGGLYRHFRSKKDLLASIVEETIEQHEAFIAEFLRLPLSEIQSDVSRQEYLQRMIGLILIGAYHYSDIVRIFFRDVVEFPDMLLKLNEGLREPDVAVFGDQLEKLYDRSPLERKETMYVASMALDAIFQRSFNMLPYLQCRDEKFVRLWTMNIDRALGHNPPS